MRYVIAMKKCAILFLFAALALPQMLCAQYYNSPFYKARYNNVTVGFRGGPGGYLIDTKAKAPTSLGYEAGFDIGYTYLASREIGFHIGLSVSRITSGAHFENLSSQTVGNIPLFDQSTTVVRQSHFLLQVPSMQETYTTFYLEMPVQAVFQYQHWWAQVGAKVMLPIMSEAAYDYAETTVGVGTLLDGTGTKLELPVHLYDSPASAGTYEIASLTGGTICYPMYLALDFEGGYRFGFSAEHQLYLGLYASFALNQTSVGGEEFFSINTDAAMYGASLGEPSIEGKILTSPLVHHLRLFSAGVKVQYQLGFGRKIGTYRSKPFKSKRYGRKRRTYGVYYQ